MTLAELDDKLPNGMHDAYLVGCLIAFDQGTATLWLKLLVSKVGEIARYANARIQLVGLVAFVVEGPERICRISAPLRISSFETSDEHFPAFSHLELNHRRLFHSLYVEEPWNSFIHIAAETAEVIWEIEDQPTLGF